MDESEKENKSQENIADSDACCQKQEVAQTEKSVASEKEKTGISPKKKVDILLRATGDTPIMKTKKWAVESDRNVGSIIDFVKRYLKLDVTDSLYLYVNQNFAPSPDQTILNLFESFGSDGKLVLHYCKTPAWG